VHAVIRGSALMSACSCELYCLVVRTVHCVWWCALYTLSGGAHCTLCLVVSTVHSVWWCALCTVSGGVQTTIDFYDYRMKRKEVRKAGRVSCFRWPSSSAALHCAL